jgi:hypothetical protein
MDIPAHSFPWILVPGNTALPSHSRPRSGTIAFELSLADERHFHVDLPAQGRDPDNGE